MTKTFVLVIGNRGRARKTSDGVFLPKNEYKKDTLQNTECLIVFNLFSYSYKAVVRGQKFLYFRSKLGLSYNNVFRLVGYVGEKSHLTSSLDSNSKLSLVKSASSANTSGENLCSLGDKLSKLGYVLVIDAVNLILAEDANLLSSVHGTEGALCIVSIHC